MTDVDMRNYISGLSTSGVSTAVKDYSDGTYSPTHRLMTSWRPPGYNREKDAAVTSSVYANESVGVGGAGMSPLASLIQRYGTALDTPIVMTSRGDDVTPRESRDGDPTQYFCHVCPYVGLSQEQYNEHMDTHFEHRCLYCSYSSRTEGRLRRHIKDFHSITTTPNNNNNITASTSTSTSTNSNTQYHTNAQVTQSRLIKCRQCNFSTKIREEFWTHSRVHIRPDKMLSCPKCPFVTEFKHHLEYHLRNHFGSKPFQCCRCNYSCVNRSMLNSHNKSHTNVYQYRCADCSYATKYCHSLKLHLRKHTTHRPATVLNPDGSLPTDGSGDFNIVARRGPPRGPRKTASAAVGPHTDSRPPSTSLLSTLSSQTSPTYTSPFSLSAVSRQLFTPTHNNNNSVYDDVSSVMTSSDDVIECSLCTFVAESYSQLAVHCIQLHSSASCSSSLHSSDVTMDERPLANIPAASCLPLDLTAKVTEPPASMTQVKNGIKVNYVINDEVDSTSVLSDESVTSQHGGARKRSRKGKAYKLEIQSNMEDEDYCVDGEGVDGVVETTEDRMSGTIKDETAAVETSVATPTVANEHNDVPSRRQYLECVHCHIGFGDCITYTLHMGYHGYNNPFQCNMCGHRANDKIDFFIHIARVAHTYTPNNDHLQ